MYFRSIWKTPPSTSFVYVECESPLSKYIPWKQNVDLTIVVVVMADAKKALSVSMYCHAEQPRILHSLNLANVAVGKVSDYREFLVKKPGQNVTTEIAHDGESIVNPSEILSQKQKK